MRLDELKEKVASGLAVLEEVTTERREQMSVATRGRTSPYDNDRTRLVSLVYSMSTCHRL